MNRTHRVLLVVAIVVSLVEIFATLVTIVDPDSGLGRPGGGTEQFTSVLVYWPAGLLILWVGIALRRKARLLAESFAIGGVYLMLLGNNGGLFQTSAAELRLTTSVITLVILVYLTIRLEREQAKST